MAYVPTQPGRAPAQKTAATMVLMLATISGIAIGVLGFQGGSLARDVANTQATSGALAPSPNH